MKAIFPYRSNRTVRIFVDGRKWGPLRWMGAAWDQWSHWTAFDKEMLMSAQRFLVPFKPQFFHSWTGPSATRTSTTPLFLSLLFFNKWMKRESDASNWKVSIVRFDQFYFSVLQCSSATSLLKLWKLVEYPNRIQDLASPPMDGHGRLLNSLDEIRRLILSEQCDCKPPLINYLHLLLHCLLPLIILFYSCFSNWWSWAALSYKYYWKNWSKILLLSLFNLLLTYQACIQMGSVKNIQFKKEYVADI